MLPLKDYSKNPRVLLSSLLRKYGSWIPDCLYLKMMYYLKIGKRLNLNNPQTFSEKLQWLKLYNRRPEYTMMVDKYTVKDYVARIIGKEYIIPTLGIWDRLEDIDFDALPDQFVLKTVHGGGSCGVVICKDKDTFDKEEATKKLSKAMKQNIYDEYREWPYKNVRRRVISEKYIGKGREELNDYKFFCFNGVPKYCQVISGRNASMSIDFYDLEWHHQPFHEPKEYPFSLRKLSPPKSLFEMIRLSQSLSKGIPFVRVDFYEVDEHPFFGELTFFPTSGLGGFAPEDWDEVLGRMIQLPQ